MLFSLFKKATSQSRDTKTLWENNLWLYSKLAKYDPRNVCVGFCTRSQNTLNSTSRSHDSDKINPYGHKTVAVSMDLANINYHNLQRVRTSRCLHTLYTFLLFQFPCRNSEKSNHNTVLRNLFYKRCHMSTKHLVLPLVSSTAKDTQLFGLEP